MYVILVIDDDEIVARTIQLALKVAGYQVMVANSGQQGLKLARRHPPDLVVLDVAMPGMDGYDVCRQLRGDPLLQDVPVLFLTARAADEDKIQGFRAGADDYLTKPFNMDELYYRAKAILRRTGTATPETALDSETSEEQHLLRLGDVTLDTRRFQVTTPAGTSQLTNTQFDLLYHLMNNPGQAFSARQLLSDVWNLPPKMGTSEIVRSHIKNLREKVEPEPNQPRYIRTRRGHGYMFKPSEKR